MFRCNHHHQGAHYMSLLKLQPLKQSIKIHWCGKSGSVAAYVIRSLLVYVSRTVPNSAVDIHQQGPDNICSHTTRFTTPMYFD